MVKRPIFNANLVVHNVIKMNHKYVAIAKLLATIPHHEEMPNHSYIDLLCNPR